MPDPQEILIWVIAVPVAITLVATLLAHVPLKRDRATQPWGPALAIAAGFAAAYAGLRGRPPFPPRDAQTWLVYLGGVAVLIAIATSIAKKRSRWILIVPSVVLIAATAWFVGRSQIPIIGWRQFLIRLAVIAACMVAWWVLVDLLAARVKGAAVPLVLMLTASVAALAIVDAGSVFVGQLAGASAATLGALMVVGLWFRKLSLAGGGVLALTVVLLGVVLAGYFIVELSMLDLILLSAAPLAAWVGEVKLIKSKRSRFAARIIAVLLILLIPLVPALKGLRETMQEQTDSYVY